MTTKQHTAHTPGPYRVQRWGDGKLSVDAGQHTIANLNDSGDETPANAQLLASAPALLEALEALADAVDAVNWVGARARAAQARNAIALAKGETE